MNFKNGTAKTLLDKVVDYKIREKALDTAQKSRGEEYIQERQKIFQNCLRMTAGVSFTAGNLSLSDGKVYDVVKQQHENRQKKLLDAERKRKEEADRLTAKVAAIRNKSMDPTKWNSNELQTMVSWFKRPGDSKIPQRKEQLLQ
jgi:hypothetical protein